MNITTLSNQEFVRSVSKAYQASQAGPVFITEHGQPAHVLMTIEDYQRLLSSQTNIVNLLAMSTPEDIPFEAPQLKLQIFQQADLT